MWYMCSRLDYLFISSVICGYLWHVFAIILIFSDRAPPRETFVDIGDTLWQDIPRAHCHFYDPTAPLHICELFRIILTPTELENPLFQCPHHFRSLFISGCGDKVVTLWGHCGDSVVTVWWQCSDNVVTMCCSDGVVDVCRWCLLLMHACAEVLTLFDVACRMGLERSYPQIKRFIFSTQFVFDPIWRSGGQWMAFAYWIFLTCRLWDFLVVVALFLALCRKFPL